MQDFRIAMIQVGGWHEMILLRMLCNPTAVDKAWKRGAPGARFEEGAPGWQGESRHNWQHPWVHALTDA